MNIQSYGQESDKLGDMQWHIYEESQKANEHATYEGRSRQSFCT